MKKSAITLLCIGLLALSGCDTKDTTVAPSTETASGFVSGDTTVHVSGQNNFRDLGGYVGAGGKRVLFGKLFRSGALNKLTAADRDTVTARGIQQVIDLRTASEVASAADSLPTAIPSYKLPLIADDSGSTGSQSAFMAAVMAGTIDGKTYMLAIYDTIDSLKVANWRQVFALLQTGKPTLWHCTAGKDRAGMTSTLVLSALGVDSAVIVRDFLKSNSYMSASIEAQITQLNAAYGAGVGEKLRPILGVDATYIQAFFTAVNKQYGSMSAFLTELGVDTAKLRSLYLEK